MRLFLLGTSLALAIPAMAFAGDLKEDLGKIGSAYEQHFNKQDAAGITSLFTKDYLRVSQNGIEADNTKFYEGAFKAGMNHLEITTDAVQPLSENVAVQTGEAKVSGKNDKGEPIGFTALWSSVNVKENGQWKIRMLTSFPKPVPAVTASAAPAK